MSSKRAKAYVKNAAYHTVSARAAPALRHPGSRADIAHLETVCASAFGSFLGKKFVVVCRPCGHEYSVHYYEAEEATERRIRTTARPPPCPKCGSNNVELHS